MNICAITHPYNEWHNLPIWMSYYGGQLGERNCIIVDHGSDDAAIACRGEASLLRLPRGAFDDVRRSDAMSALATSLLKYYDVVIYTDTDELIVADPRQYSGLRDFFARTKAPAYTCVGLNLIHNIHSDNPYDPGRPFLAQRQFCQFSSYLCKTLATRRPIVWGGGFHSSNAPPAFSDLFLFHLRHADFGEAFKRLAVTRDLTWADPNAGLHQRQPNAALFQHFQAVAGWEQSAEFSQIEEFKVKLLEDVFFNEHQHLYYLPDLQPAVLHRIPDWFGHVF